jgi:hypothetical protein
LPRPLPSPLREEETSCSTRGAFHRRVTPTRMRGSVPISFAITCVFATTQPSASFHPRFLKCRFRETLSYRRARSPSLPIGPSRAVYAGRRLALLWIRLPPNDFCNLLPTHGHAPEHPIPAVRHAPLSRIAMPNLPSISSCFTARCLRHGALRHDDLPLSKKDHENCEPRQSFRSPLDGAASAPQSKDPENPRPIETPLAGDASIQPSFAAMAVGRERWTARAEEPLSEGPAPYAACCRRTTRVKVPLLTELLEHPWVSSTLCTAGWMLPPSS